jgi:hypothetical protein
VRARACSARSARVRLQAQFLQHLPESRIGPQAAQHRVGEHAQGAGVAGIEGELPPLEGGVVLAAPGVRLSDLLGHVVAVLADQFGQGGIGGGTVAAHAIGQRVFEME